MHKDAALRGANAQQPLGCVAFGRVGEVEAVRHLPILIGVNSSVIGDTQSRQYGTCARAGIDWRTFMAPESISYSRTSPLCELPLSLPDGVLSGLLGTMFGPHATARSSFADGPSPSVHHRTALTGPATQIGSGHSMAANSNRLQSTAFTREVVDRLLHRRFLVPIPHRVEPQLASRSTVLVGLERTITDGEPPPAG